MIALLSGSSCAGKWRRSVLLYGVSFHRVFFQCAVAMIGFALAPQAAHAAFLFSVDWAADVARDDGATGIVDPIALSSGALALDAKVSDLGLLADSLIAESSGAVLANPAVLLAAICEPLRSDVPSAADGPGRAWRDAMADVPAREPDADNIGQEVPTTPLTATLDVLSLPPSAELPSRPPFKFSNLIPERPTVALVGVGLF